MRFFHWVFDIGKVWSNHIGFFIRNPTWENWHQVNNFFWLEIRRWKTDVGPTCFFHWKPDIRPTCFFHRESNIGKPMSGQRIFFIWITTSSHCVFLSEILTLENRRWTNVFFYWKSNVRKPTSGQHVYFIRNRMSENQLFSLKAQCWKTKVRQHVFYIRNVALEKRHHANVFFHQKSDIWKPMSGLCVVFFG